MREMLKTLVMPQLNFKDVLSGDGGVLQKRMLAFKDDGTMELTGITQDQFDALKAATEGEGGEGKGGPSSSAAPKAILAIEDQKTIQMTCSKTASAEAQVTVTTGESETAETTTAETVPIQQSTVEEPEPAVATSPTGDGLDAVPEAAELVVPVQEDVSCRL